MVYGFIGTGNLMNALVSGCIRSGGVQPEAVYVYDVSGEALQNAVRKFDVQPADSAVDVVAKADIVFLTVKPNVVPSVLEQIKYEVIKKPVTLVSAAAGVSIAGMEAVIGTKTAIVRTMPNLNAAVCEALTSLCRNKCATNEQFQSVEHFFNLVGKTIILDEDMFSDFCAISGCAPAFTYLFVDSIAKGAHKNGMSKKMAMQIAAQAAYGSAKMLLETERHAWDLIDMVCSPGGTAIEGICELHEYKFESAVIHAVTASIKKDKKL